MLKREQALRAYAVAGLAALVLLCAHYAIWIGAGLPSTLHPSPASLAAPTFLLVVGAVAVLAKTWSARRAQSPLDTVPAERGLVPFCVGLAAIGEAAPLVLAIIGLPTNIHVNALTLAGGVLSAPALLKLLFPAPAVEDNPWAGTLDEAAQEATRLRAAPQPNPVTTTSSPRPAFLREVPNPGIAFPDVVGLDGAKQDVAESIRLMEDPALAKMHGIEPVRGILLHGPPGTGKTFFARATAGQFGKRFLDVRASDLVSQYVGETEKNIAAAFAYARQVGPAILFIDEIDGLARNRALARNDWEISRVNALLTEMDGITKDPNAPIVIGATNRIDDLDPAILRPGRFDRKILVGLPTPKDRSLMLQHMLKGSELAAGFQGSWLVRTTEGMSPAELKALVQDVKRRIFREGRPTPRPITAADFQAALASVRLTATQEVPHA